MLSIAWDQIMESIGGIKNMENRLGGRKPDHGKRKPVQNHTRNEFANESNARAAANQSPPDSGTQIGQKVDTTA